jgi:hypothetical protein
MVLFINSQGGAAMETEAGVRKKCGEGQVEGDRAALRQCCEDKGGS